MCSAIQRISYLKLWWNIRKSYGELDSHHLLSQMDHLPLPKDPSFPLPRVPYICGDRNHCVDFLTYPAERAVEWQVYFPETGTGIVGSWLSKIAERGPDGVVIVDAILQSWIFFGLLRELLQPTGLFDVEDYVDTDDEGPFVHTRGLVPRLEKWVDIVAPWSAEEKKDFGIRLFDCLKLAGGCLTFYYHDYQPVRGGNHTIKISNATICEVVHDFAQKHLIRDAHVDGGTGYAYVDLSSESVVAHMLNNGWCPSEIGNAQSKYSSAVARHFIQRIRKPTLGLDHGSCTVDGCSQAQITVDDYEPKHVTDRCVCDLVGPDPTAIAACLESGSFPLLRILGGTGQGDVELGHMERGNLGQGNEISIEVVPHDSGAEYVALSHVWADGLGNPRANLLPKCQVLRLCALIATLRGREFHWGEEGQTDKRKYDGELFLWIDSLCCPTIPRTGATDLDHTRKASAIERLQAVYRSATYVLVLDRALASTLSKDMSTAEITVRLLTSRWMGRLWTLQESVLPKKVLIQFQDEVIDVRKLWKAIKEHREDTAMSRSFFRDLVSQIVKLRAWHSLNESESLHLMVLMDAVCHRRVTVPTDEPICVANILQLDVTQITSTEGNLKMATLWRLISTAERGIPPGTVFLGFPRLPNPGFRWAPSTFQEPLSRRLRRLMVDTDEISPATLTPRGLLIRRPGVRIRGGIPPWGFESMISPKFQMQDYILVQHLDGGWYGVHIHERIDLDPELKLLGVLRDTSRDWHLILDHRSETVQNNRCLLVYPETTTRGGPNGQGTSTVWRSTAVLLWNRVDLNQEVILRAAEERATALRRHPVVRMLQLQLLHDSALNRAAVASPVALGGLIRRWLEFSASYLGRHVVHRFGKLANEHAAVVAERPEVAAALRRLRPDDPSPAMVTPHVRLGIWGYPAKVIGEFGYDTEWCVD